MDNESPVIVAIVPEPIEISKPIFVTKGKRNSNTTLAIGIVIVGVVLALLFFYRGVFVAATVNGSPITRLSIVQKLEAQGGQQALDGFIVEKLIQSEVAKQGVEVTDAEVDAEIATVEETVKAQGATLADALAQQGMTLAEFRKNIRIQKEVEKLVGDKANVTDEEVTAYMTENKIELPKGAEEAVKKQIAAQLKGEKVGTAAQELITTLKANANIKQYVSY